MNILLPCYPSMNLPNTKNRLLSAGITHCSIMFAAGWRRVQNPQIICAGAPVIGRRAVVPHHHHLLHTFKVSDSADMALAAVLFAPLPVGTANHAAANTFHHQPWSKGVEKSNW